MTLEQIKLLTQWQPFMRSLEVAVVKTAQAISGDPEGNRKSLAGQVLDNSIWARDKFSINVASQSNVITTVTVDAQNNFSVNDVSAFDTALETACSAVWDAEAKV